MLHILGHKFAVNCRVLKLYSVAPVQFALTLAGLVDVGAGLLHASQHEVAQLLIALRHLDAVRELMRYNLRDGIGTTAVDVYGAVKVIAVRRPRRRCSCRSSVVEPHLLPEGAADALCRADILLAHAGEYAAPLKLRRGVFCALAALELFRRRQLYIALGRNPLRHIEARFLRRRRGRFGRRSGLLRKGLAARLFKPIQKGLCHRVLAVNRLPVHPALRVVVCEFAVPFLERAGIRHALKVIHIVRAQVSVERGKVYPRGRCHFWAFNAAGGVCPPADGVGHGPRALEHARAQRAQEETVGRVLEVRLILLVEQDSPERRLQKLLYAFLRALGDHAPDEPADV